LCCFNHTRKALYDFYGKLITLTGAFEQLLVKWHLMLEHDMHAWDGAKLLSIESLNMKELPCKLPFTLLKSA
jgi:hypothetical protein